ncbi:hypothetical protein BIW11_13220 [Tropilaelaps mercedesae]|uniref:Uncharacterized protein n=1 Tax=Tropilaelaps mercedesae TaxID=418985 RepID=A0A1V9X2W9_9ACAR|nr:hypothetical protein BIW11_13220 [Tropilaelaps mercedesae]
MDAFISILIVVAGISIGVIGLLIIAVFVWLHKRYTPSIPTNPYSSQAALGTTSSTWPLSEPSWDNIAVYNSEGGEHDNRAFDREALQLATMRAFPPNHPQRKSLDISYNGQKKNQAHSIPESNAPDTPSSNHDEVDKNQHVYNELAHHHVSAGHKGKVPAWRGPKADSLSSPNTGLEAANSAPTTVGRHQSSDLNSNHRGPVEATNDLHRLPTAKLEDRNAMNGPDHGSAARATETRPRTSAADSNDRSALRPSQLKSWRRPSEPTDRSSVKATSFKDERSDASIVLTPFRLTLPPPVSSEETGDEMFI